MKILQVKLSRCAIPFEYEYNTEAQLKALKKRFSEHGLLRWMETVDKSQYGNPISFERALTDYPRIKEIFEGLKSPLAKDHNR